MKRTWRFLLRIMVLVAVVFISVWSIYYLQWLEIAAASDQALFKIVVIIFFAVLCLVSVRMFISLEGLDRVTGVVLNMLIFVIIFLFVFFLKEVSWPNGFGILLGSILLIIMSLPLASFNKDYSLDEGGLYKIENIKNLLLYAWWK